MSAGPAHDSRHADRKPQPQERHNCRWRRPPPTAITLSRLHHEIGRRNDDPATAPPMPMRTLRLFRPVRLPSGHRSFPRDHDQRQARRTSFEVGPQLPIRLADMPVKRCADHGGRRAEESMPHRRWPAAPRPPGRPARITQRVSATTGPLSRLSCRPRPRKPAVAILALDGVKNCPDRPRESKRSCHSASFTALFLSASRPPPRPARSAIGFLSAARSPESWCHFGRVFSTAELRNLARALIAKVEPVSHFAGKRSGGGN